jgi:hypothetical protein
VEKIKDLSFDILKKCIDSQDLLIMISLWKDIIPEDIYRFSYPQKIHQDVVTICVANHKVVDFTHYTDSIIRNINQALGKNSISEISIKQFTDYRKKNKKNVSAVHDEESFGRCQELINNTQNPSVKNSLSNMLHSLKKTQ